MEREIRMAGYDPTQSAAAGIATANGNSIRVTLDITEDGDTGDADEDITYCLSDSDGDGDNDLERNGNFIAENINALDFVYLEEYNTPQKLDEGIRRMLACHTKKEASYGKKHAERTQWGVPQVRRLDSRRKNMKEKCLLRNEDGSVLVIALIMIVLLTLLGISATTTSQIEIQITENERSHEIAFYAAEAAGAYVVGSPELYGPDNITVGGYIDFPDNEDPSAKFPLGSTKSFNGDVEYLGSSAPPRGSGSAVGKFKSHNYRMTCNGYRSPNSESQIQAGFYRIGF